jgi:hypothetical protein
MPRAFRPALLKGKTNGIREILMQEQEHQIDLATALGIEVPHPKREK